MYRTFNMGVGMVVITSPLHRSDIESHVKQLGSAIFHIGNVTPGDQEVSIQ